MLPHSPWTYLPSGTRYDVRPAPGWGSDEVWTSNQAAVDQYWQRHLLQLGYADRVLGRLLDRLHASGLYDRAVLVVTADHGVSFRAGQKRRPLSPANRQDIAYVPLFVKTPGQRTGRTVSQARANDRHPPHARRRDRASGSRGTSTAIRSSAAAGRALGDPDQGQGPALRDPGGRPRAAPRAGAAASAAALRVGRAEPRRSSRVGPDRGLLGHSFEGGRRVTDLDSIERSGPLVQVSGRATGRSVVVVAGGRVVAVDPDRAGSLLDARPARKARRQATCRLLHRVGRGARRARTAATGRARRAPARRPRNERAPQLSNE